eukprot:m.166602 g.166602  ORF g.166602 m.166602 type:complete len:76 (-) comp16438_c0_seq1:462-689(-)
MTGEDAQHPSGLIQREVICLVFMQLSLASVSEQSTGDHCLQRHQGDGCLRAQHASKQQSTSAHQGQYLCRFVFDP